ncbi:MAG: TOBE domain-containing protein [Caldilineaceae bacterium]
MHLHTQNGYENHFGGRVSNVVYIGTDTQYAIQLPGDQIVRVREQNSTPGSRPVASEGAEVTVSFAAQAARVLTE